MSDLILDIFSSRLFRFHVFFLGTLYFNAYCKYHMFLLLFFQFIIDFEENWINYIFYFVLLYGMLLSIRKGETRIHIFIFFRKQWKIHVFHLNSLFVILVLMHFLVVSLELSV